MSNQINPLASLQSPEPVAPTGARSNAKSDGTFPAPVPAAVAAQLCPNPSMRLDGALGIVVMQFHDESGKVVATIPTAQQLDAYRRSSGQGHGTAAPGAARPVTAETSTAAVTPSVPPAAAPGPAAQPAAPTAVTR